MDESNQPWLRSRDRMAFQTFNSKSTFGNFAILDYDK
jgi:hypothetical protein